MVRSVLLLSCAGLMMGVLALPVGRHVVGPPDCKCSGTIGTPGATCGQCAGTIKLMIGCTVCCETMGGTVTVYCSQTDGPGR